MSQPIPIARPIPSLLPFLVITPPLPTVLCDSAWRLRCFFSLVRFVFHIRLRMAHASLKQAATEAEAIIKWAELRSSLPRVQRTQAEWWVLSPSTQAAPVSFKLWWVRLVFVPDSFYRMRSVKNTHTNLDVYVSKVPRWYMHFKIYVPYVHIHFNINIYSYSKVK